MARTKRTPRLASAAVAAAIGLGVVAMTPPRTAHAADIEAWIPAPFIQRQIALQLEAFFPSADLGGVLSWPALERTVRVSRVTSSKLRVEIDLRYNQPIPLPQFVLPAGASGQVRFDVGMACASNKDLRFDVSNFSQNFVSEVFVGDALAGIDQRIEDGLNGVTSNLDEMLGDATALYGNALILKCASATVGADQALDLRFDMGTCYERSERWTACRPGRVGLGFRWQCIAREWVQMEERCEPEPPDPNL